ncbi:unnamed protein product [Arctia plantaginis]|uniref:Uncharacterized protein n=1 Tax=Arctia plantaginis TaxID=874455 RepID=A0A8S1BEY3_ARCPL|nr:unnamed protein product [Arctia plantaginis]
MKGNMFSAEELTDPVHPDLDAFLDVDGVYGMYTTQNFEYVNWQHYYEDEPYFLKEDYYHVVLIDARCSADHVKCLSNLEMPIPVCAYFWKTQVEYHRYKVFESYCHVYLENCLHRHRRYRMLNYGGCYLNNDEYPSKWQYPPHEPSPFDIPYNTWG